MEEESSHSRDTIFTNGYLLIIMSDVISPISLTVIIRILVVNIIYFIDKDPFTQKDKLAQIPVI